MPLTAAMTGFHRSHDFGPRSRPGSSYMNALLVPNRLPSAPDIGSLRSTPTLKARSPAPVITATLTESSTRRSRHTLRSATCIWTLKALSTSGRARVINITEPRRSTVRVEYDATVDSFETGAGPAADP